jgi:hypothetical protein
MIQGEITSRGKACKDSKIQRCPESDSRKNDNQRPVVRNDTIGALLSGSAGGKTTLASHLADLSARHLSYEGGTA